MRIVVERTSVWHLVTTGADFTRADFRNASFERGEGSSNFSYTNLSGVEDFTVRSIDIYCNTILPDGSIWNGS